MSAERAEVLVVGGGIMGCGVAWQLARAGLEVVLFERGELNRGASGSNAGTIHLQLRQHEDRSAGRLGLIRESAGAWRTLERELGLDIGLRLHGGLMVAETPAEAEALVAKQAVEAELGLDPELLDGAAARRREPALSEAVLAASWCPHEGSANPLLATDAIARRARECGVRIERDREVVTLERSGSGGFRARTAAGTIEARRVVCAAGAWTAPLLGSLGLGLPVGSVALSVTVTEALSPLLGSVVQHASRKLTMKQTADGTFLLGGGWLGEVGPGGERLAPADSIAGNAWVAAHVVPALAGVRALRSWAGVLPVTPDAMPVLGEHPGAPGLWVLVVPVGAAGFTVAPLVTAMLAERIVSRPGLEPRRSAGFEEYGPGRASLAATL
jgi:glycine/D-amino acid oxidase-like deaminating enzyme